MSKEYSGGISGLLRGEYPAVDTVQEMPLTTALRDSVENNISTARRAFNTLSQLRDRLLGYPPQALASGNNATDVEPSSFADAMRRSNNALAQSLNALESLAEEISLRL